ncbi:MAG: 1-hydroxycarotenoid 3,4-desaturase CrtD [Polyangiaceae bacterium]
MSGASRQQRVVVVGAGVGGLACALQLAQAGYGVTVVERASVVGGKLRVAEVGGVAIDAGPTVLTMRWVFDELFALAGRDLDAYVPLTRVDVLARHAWPDGSRLDLFADRDRSAAAIAEMCGRAEAQRFLAFCTYTQRIFEAVEGPFLRSQRPTFGSLMKHAARIGMGAVTAIDAHRTMWSALQTHFRDPRLLQLFGRYATYVGSSPFEAPATLNLIAHVESRGVNRVRGGMRALGSGLERLARELGVAFRFDAHVSKILVHAERAAGVELENGETIEADAVVCNADVSAIATGLLGAPVARVAKATDRKSRSFSAVTWAVRGHSNDFPLLHHNVFFSSDYRAELAELTRQQRCPTHPTVYVCAQDRNDEAALHYDERFLLVVNAPATGDDAAAWSREERERCEENAFSSMARCGLTLTKHESIQTTPADFHRAFPATGGALYGPTANGSLSTLARSGARTKLAHLYLAGGSVHPGPGLPMAALSGRRAAESVHEDLGSTARSKPAAISGTISTV